MLLKIKSPSYEICIPAVNAGPIVAALENAFPVTTEGWGKDQKWVKAEGEIECSFVAEGLLDEKPEPLKKALQNYETAQSNWLGEYNKRTKAEAEVKALKEKLAAIGHAVVGEEAKA